MSTEPETAERTTWSPWAIAAAALLLLLFGVIAVGTIRGCILGEPEEAAKAKETDKEKEGKEKKKDFEIEFAAVQPSELKTPLHTVKPGHWVTATQQMVANLRDLVGDSRAQIVDGQGRPYPVSGTPFVELASRPVLLTKGRPKPTESTFFIPPVDKPLNLSTSLEERGLGFSLPPLRSALTRMPSYQYHFVVLAKEPARYSFIKSIDSVRVPYDGDSDADDTEDAIHYRVVQLDATKAIPLSDNPLTWTSIAYILWDNVDPGDPFSTGQETALIDWLNWGGELIINGPGSLDLLKGSFLAPYLPATNDGPRTIAADDPAIADLNTGWTVSGRPAPPPPLTVKAPWSAIKLAPHPDAKYLPNTGELFIERRVGRGRIVVSAVQLSERDFINWRSGFQSFFNAGLMRRPPRQYYPGHFGDVTLHWADEENKPRRLDARLNTNLSYFSRDLGLKTAYQFRELPGDDNSFAQFDQAGNPIVNRKYQPSSEIGGIGGWNDFSAAANAARVALREAAGVEVPGAGFVIACLAAYLVALVPLNWLIFHTLGRVEWAWIAAPIIAVVGTMVIVQRAQLDIGFVRAQTEIGIIEQQPEHPRAHLARYTALYTSLSSTYDMEFSNLTTVVAPFSANPDFQMLSGQGVTDVDYLRYDTVRLNGLPISSNSTGMVHSEQMVGLDGPIRIGTSTATGGRQIENRSKLQLDSVCIVRRPAANERGGDAKSPSDIKLEGVWVGQLAAGKSFPIPNRLQTGKSPFNSERAAEAKLLPSPRLNLEPLFKLALDPQYMEPGEIRLVARADQVMPGQTITPAASQVRGSALVIAHLHYDALAPPRADKNTRQDIKAKSDDDFEADFGAESEEQPE